jgi:hypothetical protein
MFDHQVISVILIFYAWIYVIECNCGPKDSGAPVAEILMWSGGSWAGFTHGDIFPPPNYLGAQIDKSNTHLRLQIIKIIVRTLEMSHRL